MLEDLNMEKKPSNRPIQTPSKGSGSENKKNQDVNKQQFPKSSRRREPPNSNGPRLEQSRKPAPQKTKTLDKRPRSRSQYYGGGKEGAQKKPSAQENRYQNDKEKLSLEYLKVEEYEAELDSLYSAGSKKQNLNHLLNFHYAPRGESVRPVHRPSYQYGVKWLMSTQKHKYNKEHFLQANCQFVVKDDTDYSPFLADPDLLVNWEFIEQIRVASLEPVNCPICLCKLVAGKMTRCGHTYCYPCILHYLALSDKTWRKCPICFESVHKNDLKSVKVECKTAYSVGQQITFQLMTRERGSLLACPVSQYEVRTKQKPVLNVSEHHLDTAFAKLLTANMTEVLQIIEQEMKELEQERVDNQGCPELCFIEQALELCGQRKQNLESQESTNTASGSPLEENSSVNELFTKPTTLPIETAKPTEEAESLSSSLENNVVYESAFDNTLLDVNKNTLAEEKSEGLCEENGNSCRQRYESLSSEGEDMSPTTITAEDLEVAPHPTAAPAKQFYFYQACDGQQIYLHAVNVQMLEMTYGTLRECPATLTGVIVEKEAGSMTTDLRRRLRYLQHLPVTAQFEVAEIQLLPPAVTQETLDAFSDQLDQRRRRRQKRDREERKREKKIAEVELRQMGRHSTPRLRLDSFHHFPQCGIPEDEIPAAQPRVTSAESSRASSPLSRRSVSPTPALAALTVDSQDSGPSFAQMLRSSSGVGVKNRAWGVAVAASKPPPSPPRHTVDSDGETAPAPGYRQSFSDAIAVALQQASEQKDEAKNQGGKKKKKKQKVLFATGMACTSK